MMDFCLKRIIALVLCLGVSLNFNSTVHAADFADVTVESVVGQQVSGFVELAQLSPSDLASLEIKLASRSTYADNDVAYYSVHKDLRFQPKAQTNGAVQLDIVSIGPLREPKLKVLLRITWPDGDLLQGLTLSVPFTQAALVANKTVLTASADNLWQLAKRTRDGSRVSIAQQMLALQRLNPNAFSNGNINGLKSGYLLRIPDFMAAVAVDKSAALDAVEGQHSQWRNVLKSDPKDDQKSAENSRRDGRNKGGENTAPVAFELGADLPPAERRGEVRIFQPENPSAADADFDPELNADADADAEVSGLPQASIDDAPSSNGGDFNLPENVEAEISNNTNAGARENARPVNIDQSVNDEIDLMMAEDSQSGYSAQFVWLVAGGILGVLIVVMLLRRQMAERKKNLEDAWVADAESDDLAAYEVDEPELDNSDAGVFDSQYDLDSESDAEENSNEVVQQVLAEALAEVGQEVAQTIEPPIPAQEPGESEELEKMEEPEKPEEPKMPEEQEEQEESGPIEPSIVPAEEVAAATENDETFLDTLAADEQPLEETSNTEVYTTRLKLAEAYLEMGDETGARDMLEEVVAEGDDAQKALAKSIIQRIDDALDDSKDS